MKSHVKYRLAFTLVELLVVISIIGLLASLVLAALTSARVKSRDTRRIEDIQEIRAALELYFHDNNRYPDDIYAAANSLAPKYIGLVPLDPRGGASRYFYKGLSSQALPGACAGNCLYYHLGAYMETALPDGNNVLKSDSDLYFDGNLNNAVAGDFEGSSNACTNAQVAQGLDGCYDVTP